MWIGTSYHLFEVRQAPRKLDPCLLRHLTNCGLRTCPYDGIDGWIISKNIVFISIDIDPGNQVGLTNTKKIEKGTILTKIVGIIGIIDSTFAISEEQQTSGLKCFFQFFSSFCIDLFTKHSLKKTDSITLFNPFARFLNYGIPVFIHVAFEHFYLDIRFHTKFNVFFFGIEHGGSRESDGPPVW